MARQYGACLHNQNLFICIVGIDANYERERDSEQKNDSKRKKKSRKMRNNWKWFDNGMREMPYCVSLQHLIPLFVYGFETFEHSEKKSNLHSQRLVFDAIFFSRCSSLCLFRLATLSRLYRAFWPFFSSSKYFASFVNKMILIRFI